MEQADINRFIEYELRARWPRWKPSAIELGDWTHFLEPATYDEARKAVMNARAHSNTITFPVLAEFCRALERTTPKYSSKQPVQGVNCCMICTESDNLDVIKPGTRRGLYVYAPGHVRDPEAYAINKCKNDIDKYNKDRQMQAKFEIHIIDEKENSYLKCLRRSTEIRTGKPYVPPKDVEEARQRYLQMRENLFRLPSDVGEIVKEDLIDEDFDDELPF